MQSTRCVGSFIHQPAAAAQRPATGHWRQCSLPGASDHSFINQPLLFSHWRLATGDNAVYQ
eukprot:9294708-Pyramimonas_sp.AAC.1